MLDNSCEDQISVYSGSMALMVAKDSCKGSLQDNGKYVRYTAEQVQALERLYNECPKPSSLRRQQLMRENPILQNIEPKQIKVWFQNRRCREKQRKESSRLQTVNSKLTAMNKLLMEENDRLRKQVAQLLYENGYLRQQLQHGGITTDTSCDSVVTSGLQHLPTTQQSPQDATYSGILSLAEEALAEFLGKATGTAVDWVQMPGMKPGPDSTQMVNISHGCAGIAARACGLVNMEPARIVEVLKDKPAWNRDCRRLTTMLATTTGSGGTIEVLYTQMYAPTTLAPARDFYTLRYTSPLEDGSYVVCERSMNASNAAPMAPQMQPFIRADMQASGCLIRPCEGTGSIVIIVDHMDLESLAVPEVLRPLYESSAVLAHKVTTAAFRHLRHLAQEGIVEAPGGGQQPAAVRSLSHRLAKGFNDAVNAFVDDGWTTITSDGVDDVTILVKAPSSNRELGVRLHSTYRAILCAKASMLLENVPSSLLVRFLREHRSEWADNSLEEAMQMGNPGFSCFHGGLSNSQVLQPQIHALEQDEFLELIKMEVCEDEDNLIGSTRDMFLLQLCSGLDETGPGACAQMVFAPVDASISDDIALIPSGFRVIPLDNGHSDTSGVSTRTLDLASTLEVGSTSSMIKSSSDNQHLRSVFTIAFQFNYESRMQESVATMARQYVRNVVSTVQRVTMALAPPRLNPPLAPARCLPEGLLLARWICSSYKLGLGMDLVHVDVESSQEYLKALWKLGDAVMCCACKTLPVFTFANQAGLEMLETSSIALQELSWEKTLDEDSKKSLCSVFSQVMQQGYACLPAGIRLSSMGRPASYDRAIAWKVLEEDEVSIHGVAFLYINWSLLHNNVEKADRHGQPLLL